jgi:Protein of unknown function (DUF1349)
MASVCRYRCIAPPDNGRAVYTVHYGRWRAGRHGAQLGHLPGAAHFFHARDDGGDSWRLVRQFALDTTEPVRAGIGIQSPVGDGCTAEFDRISLTATRLDDQFDEG